MDGGVVSQAEIGKFGTLAKVLERAVQVVREILEHTQMEVSPVKRRIERDGAGVIAKPRSQDLLRGITKS